ncbi:N-acetyltransferase [Archangium violaceum]|uniref:GNAT family N-acetyltransferase n=1 Tax=Archangium violaceum TaxID=83451 RepID=UPI00194E0820|nr:GNAT family N-acetyltransferase [Archangium violaceum]QRN96516.1 N-acetyltransferase [Archangium violaceum]
MKPRRHFDTGWRERLALADGTEVELRLVQPADAELLLEGFERLSPRSRIGRFHAAKPRLSEHEVHYLTAVDGEQHLALGAVSVGPEGQGRGLGIARFIRLAPASEVAEAAITVVDAAQGKGLGRILLERLMEAARERGVERFECHIQPGNAAMVRLLNRLLPDGAHEEEDDALRITVSLSSTPRRKWNLLLLLLALAAQGALTVLGPARSHSPNEQGPPG